MSMEESFVPIKIKTDVLGVLSLEGTKTEFDAPDFIQPLEYFSRLIAMALKEWQDREARYRFGNQAGQQQPLPAENQEQQAGRDHIDRPLQRRQKLQPRREEIGHDGDREREGEPLLVASGEAQFRGRRSDRLILCC